MTTIDPATLPIVARCDARERVRRAEQDSLDAAAYFTFVASRQMDDRRRDIATIDAVLAWAKADAPAGESPEAFGLRANLVRMAAGPP